MSVHLLRRKRASESVLNPEAGPPSVRAVVALFLSTGRNAWHSTWIKRYNAGDLFRDGRRVRNAVERRKARGTVFYLSVLPAIQIDFGDRKFVLTEINTHQPFRKIDLDTARYNLTAANLSDFLTLIDPPSSLWDSSQSRSDSVILQEVRDDFIDLTSYGLLSKGRDPYNPPVARYHRTITGSFFGESEWKWQKEPVEAPRKPITLRWYNRALEALIEGTERVRENRSEIAKAQAANAL